MPSDTITIPDITIPSGAAVSNILRAKEIYGDSNVITLYAPSALDAHTYIIETNANPSAIAGSTGWVSHQIGDPVADAAPPAAGKSRSYYELPAAASFRIKDSTSTVASDRTWKATKTWDY